MKWPAIVPRLVPRGRLQAQLPRYAGLAPTVSAVNQNAPTPAGYHPIDSSTRLPAGTQERAIEALLTMAMHRESGLLTAMPAERVREGDTVIVGVPVGPLALVVPCRVVWVSAEGFGYATLPGHPESGVEEFSVRQTLGGGVEFTVSGYSKPAGLSRLGGPVGKLAAARAITSYLSAMQRLAG